MCPSSAPKTRVRKARSAKTLPAKKPTGKKSVDLLQSVSMPGSKSGSKFGSKSASKSAPLVRAPFYRGGDSWDVEESSGYVMRRLVNSLHRQMDAHMQAQSLTNSQWGPLLLIANGRGETAGALARELDLDSGAMTRMLDRLELKGMLKRVWSADDRRMAHLQLTERGLAATKRIPDSIAAVLNHHLRGFTHAEVRQLKANLSRMLDNGREPLTSAKMPTAKVERAPIQSRKKGSLKS